MMTSFDWIKWFQVAVKILRLGLNRQDENDPAAN